MWIDGGLGARGGGETDTSGIVTDDHGPCVAAEALLFLAMLFSSL